MFMGRLHQGEGGFTLIELLIVVAILGILAAVIVPNLAGFLGTGNVAAANTEVANVESASLAYYADHDGAWPASSTVLNTDGYISDVPKYAVYTFDVWGKVDTVTEIAATAGDIAWVDADHEWQKDEAPAPATPTPVPVVPGPGCSGPAVPSG